MKWFKDLFCKHKHQTFVRNIYGDMINLLDARSIWKCDDCGKTFRDPSLCRLEHDDPNTEKIIYRFKYNGKFIEKGFQIINKTNGTVGN